MECFGEIVKGYNYFCKLQLFSQYELVAFSTSCNKYHEVVTTEVVVLCKKLAKAREGTGDLEFLVYPLINSNKLAYLRLDQNSQIPTVSEREEVFL